MERKIGEIFEHRGEWYQCLESDGCALCNFKELINCSDILDIREHCRSDNRSDGKSVIFKKLKKVGEPFACRNMSLGCYGIIVQRYKVFAEPILTDDSIRWCGSTNKTILIALNNKEDMKTVRINKDDLNFLVNKIRYGILPRHTDCDAIIAEIADLFSVEDVNLSNTENIGKNLKPFDLQAAKAGKPVCTRDGRKARIVCFDRRLFYKNVSYPILAVVERSDGEDDVCGYNEKGKVLIEDGAGYKDNLMMLPEKKEGWVNVYRNRLGGPYESKEYALRQKMRDCIDTVKISWEE